MKKPTLLKDEEIDLKELKKICQDYIDFIDNDEEYHEDNDYDYYIHEKSMQTMFGKDVFNFLNSRRG